MGKENKLDRVFKSQKIIEFHSIEIRMENDLSEKKKILNETFRFVFQICLASSQIFFNDQTNTEYF